MRISANPLPLPPGRLTPGEPALHVSRDWARPVAIAVLVGVAAFWLGFSVAR